MVFEGKRGTAGFRFNRQLEEMKVTEKEGGY